MIEEGWPGGGGRGRHAGATRGDAESVAADMEMGAIVIHEGPVGGDGAATEVVVLAKMHDKHIEVGQIGPGGVDVIH